LLDYHMCRVNQNWHDNLTRYQRPKNVNPSTRIPSVHGTVADIASALHAQAKRHVLAVVEQISSRFHELLTSPWMENLRQETHQQVGWKSAIPVPPEAVPFAQEFDKYVAAGDPVGAVGLTRAQDALRLVDLVAIPPTGPASQASIANRDRTLQRYLWGAGLLGAEHLQYAENLLLAGADLVRQAGADNIVYSEVRCSTTGYCEGGLTPYDATDILCLAFDLAAAYYGTLERPDPERPSQFLPRRWVRTNVLLGAKRHKQDHEFRGVVSLLESYLRRGEEVELQGPSRQDVATINIPGGWWSRARVVGFDMSGDESAKADGLEKHVQPLFVIC
jgi:hypothetical protein